VNEELCLGIAQGCAYFYSQGNLKQENLASSSGLEIIVRTKETIVQSSTKDGDVRM
jgi:hypothetical protein